MFDIYVILCSHFLSQDSKIIICLCQRNGFFNADV